MKNLYSWVRNKEISSSEEEVLSKLGIESSQYSSDTYSLEELKKLLFWNKVIKKVKPEINNEIQKLVTFSAWWNNDLAIAINNRENQCQVNLLIYEKPWGNIPERLKTSFIGDYSNLEEAKTKVQEVINKLNSDMPILYKYSSIELRSDKDYFFPETELAEITLPNIDITNCPDKYVKPFDVVRIHGYGQ